MLELTEQVAAATLIAANKGRLGANALLVRIGAYFHDIGKMLKPEYFAENMNQGEKSRHDSINPAISAPLSQATVPL